MKTNKDDVMGERLCTSQGSKDKNRFHNKIFGVYVLEFLPAAYVGFQWEVKKMEVQSYQWSNGLPFNCDLEGAFRMRVVNDLWEHAFEVLWKWLSQTCFWCYIERMQITISIRCDVSAQIGGCTLISFTYYSENSEHSLTQRHRKICMLRNTVYDNQMM